MLVLAGRLARPSYPACTGPGSCEPGQICARAPLGDNTHCMPHVASGDAEALRTFRAAQPSSAFGPSGCLASWSDRTDPCDAWDGVQCCGPASLPPLFLEPQTTRVCVLTLVNCGLVMADSIGELDYLLFFSFDQNAADRMPPLGRLINLVQVSMKGNSIRELPVAVGQLNKLSTLDLSANQLGDIPESVGNATALINLFLDGNRLRRLPQSLAWRPGDAGTSLGC